MAFYLNPFSRIIGHGFKSALELVTVPNAGTIISIDQSTPSLPFILTNCCGGEFEFQGWRTTADFELRNLLAACFQGEFTITGKTSGVRSKFNGAELLFDRCAKDCFTTPACQISIGTSWHSAAGANVVGSWSPSEQRANYFISVFDLAARGYTLGEAIDVELPADTGKPIVSIENRLGVFPPNSQIWIYVTGHGLPDQSRITVEGTQNYDGNYTVQADDEFIGLEDDRFWVYKPYVGDETTGTVKRKYDG